MSRTIPDYLKLHIEELAASARASTGVSFEGLCHSFASATGWDLPLAKLAAPRTRAKRRRDVESTTLEPVDDALHDGPILELARVKPLALAIGKVVAELEQSRQSLAEREAELATAIPISTPRDDARPLLRRLESLLKTATDSVQARAAAAYLLDDATSHLKMRAQYGLGPDRLFSPARSLRGQAADLEALLGRAVVMNDTRGNFQGVPPEPCGAAVCVPISSPTLPLGTLWVFADEPREFTPLQTNLIEIVAGRLAAELERHALCREAFQMGQLRRQWKQASRWMRCRTPLAEPLVDGWDVAGWTPQTEQLSGQFLDWEVLADERLVASLGRASGVALEAGLAAITLQTLLKALTPRSRDARRLVSQVHEAAWRTAAGASLGSLLHAAIVPATGYVDIAATGDVGGLIVRSQSHQTLTVGPERIGESPEAVFRSQRHLLAPGETLILLGAPLTADAQKLPSERSGTALERNSVAERSPGVRTARFSLEVQQLADLVRAHSSSGAQILTDGLRLATERAGEDSLEPVAVLVVHRRLTP